MDEIINSADFLINDSSDHLKLIEKFITECDEVYIAVAFLKLSGYSLLKTSLENAIKNNSTIKIIAGQNFSLTEPQALRKLKKMFVNTNNSLYLANALSKTSVFHPKLYLFKKANVCHIITGSINFTQGGLINNIECSLLINCSSSDQVWIKALNFFNLLINKQNAKEASLLVIKQYESYFESQRNFHNKIKSIPNKKKSEQHFNYENLLNYFNSYNNEERQTVYNEKLSHYEKAKEILDQIADYDSLDKYNFIILLEKLVSKAGSRGLWHSGSLFRKRNDIFPYYKEFQELVKFIKNNISMDRSFVFENAKKKVEKISGAGINYITEIMMSFDYNKFANLNNNPITVLKKEANVFFKSSSKSFNGIDYEEYCDLVLEIISKLELKNMLEADSFFNDIYWKIKR